MLTLLIAALKRAHAARRRRAEMLELLKKDDRTLNDIGLNRADIIAAVGAPLKDWATECGQHGSRRAAALDGLR